ncbi:MAG: rubrerythrin family protein [Candidatus Omnitrophota bacterium]
MFRRGVIVMALCVAVFSLLSGKAYAAAKPAAAKPGATLANLLSAYNGEKNAQVRYMSFAQQADKEGYKGVASLFRAAARSEQVHYEGHERAIKELGGVPKVNMLATPVKSTKENLETAINGENYESGKMYPEFLAQAEKDKVKPAIASFKGAVRVEAVHAQLFKKALKDLDSWKGQKKDFFVCLVCGNVTENKPPMVCSICGAPKEKFTAVN